MAARLWFLVRVALFPLGGEDDDGGEIPYADMIRAALLKLPGRQGNLPAVCAYIEVCNWRGFVTPLLRPSPCLMKFLEL